jgi:hypothetical protein
MCITTNPCVKPLVFTHGKNQTIDLESQYLNLTHKVIQQYAVYPESTSLYQRLENGINNKAASAVINNDNLVQFVF